MAANRGRTTGFGTFLKRRVEQERLGVAEVERRPPNAPTA